VSKGSDWCDVSRQLDVEFISHKQTALQAVVNTGNGTDKRPRSLEVL
jgi:hypothetical protein